MSFTESGPDEADKEFKQAAEDFRDAVRQVMHEAGYTQQHVAASMHVDSTTLGKYLNGRLGGLARPPQGSLQRSPPTDVRHEKIVSNLLRALGLAEAADSHPVLHTLKLGREAWIRARQTREGKRTNEGSGRLSRRLFVDLAAAVHPVAPAEVIRAVGVHDPAGALRLTGEDIPLPERGRGLAYLLEVNQDPGLRRQVDAFREQLDDEYGRSGTRDIMRSGTLRPSDVLHLRATFGVAWCRAGRPGVGMEQVAKAGMLARTLDEPLQRAHALAAAATAASLIDHEQQALSKPFGDWLPDWCRAAAQSVDRVESPPAAWLGAKAAVARARARTGDLQQAQVEAQAVESQAKAGADSRDQNKGLAAAVSAWVHIDGEHAAEVAKQIPPGPERDSAFGAIAVSHSQQGHPLLAYHYVALIEHPWEHARSLGAISYALYLIGKRSPGERSPIFAEAIQCADIATRAASATAEPHLLLHSLASLTTALARHRAGTLRQRALEYLCRLANQPHIPAHERPHTLAAAALSAARGQDKTQATSLCEMAEGQAATLDPQARVHGLLASAAAWGEIDQERAQKLLADVEQSLGGLTERTEEVHARTKLAGLRAQFGDLQGAELTMQLAWEAVGDMESGTQADHALFSLAATLVTLEGRHREALDIITDRIQGPLQKAKALAVLVRQADKDDPDFDRYVAMARSCMQVLVLPSERAEITTQLAYSFVDRRWWGQAQLEIETIEGSWQAPAWARLASVQAAETHYDEALNSLTRAFEMAGPSWAGIQSVIQGATAIAILVDARRIAQFLDYAAVTLEAGARSPQ